MEYHLRTEVLQGTEVVFDGCQEQPVDLTLSLPDYLSLIHIFWPIDWLRWQKKMAAEIILQLRYSITDWS